MLPLAGHPLIAYSIAGAQEAGIFTAVVVSTDSEEIAEVAAPVRRGGARPAPGGDEHVDLVRHRVGAARDARAATRRSSRSSGRRARSAPATTIRRAYERLVELGDRADSIRAVELVRQHPGKMWTRRRRAACEPLLPQPEGETPLHSRQYQALPKVYAQNSSLELAWSRVLDDPRADDLRASASRRSSPRAPKGFSIDYPEDIERAERMLAGGEARLPAIPQPVK